MPTIIGFIDSGSIANLIMFLHDFSEEDLRSLERSGALNDLIHYYLENNPMVADDIHRRLLEYLN